MIKFTLITCTFNAEATLRPTLESVLGQTFANVEHIIVDGQSTDATLQIVGQYECRNAEAANGHTVVLRSEPDSGLYDAMNKGLAMATGHYVCFLNAGDSLPQADTLSRVADTALKTDRLPGVLYGDTDLVDGEGRFVAHRRLAPPEKLTWRSFRHGMVVCHQAFYALTSIAQATPYDLRYRFSADVDWCIRVMKASQEQDRQLTRVRAVLANYLSEGLTTANHRASLCERFEVMRRHYGLADTALMHMTFVLRQLRGLFTKTA